MMTIVTFLNKSFEFEEYFSFFFFSLFFHFLLSFYSKKRNMTQVSIVDLKERLDAIIEVAHLIDEKHICLAWEEQHEKGESIKLMKMAKLEIMEIPLSPLIKRWKLVKIKMPPELDYWQEFSFKWHSPYYDLYPDPHQLKKEITKWRELRKALASEYPTFITKMKVMVNYDEHKLHARLYRIQYRFHLKKTLQYGIVLNERI